MSSCLMENEVAIKIFEEVFTLYSTSLFGLNTAVSVRLFAGIVKVWTASSETNPLPLSQCENLYPGIAIAVTVISVP